MTQVVRDLMTSDPTILGTTRTVTEAARRMRDEDIGVILVQEEGAVCGVLTDRDIVVRMIAEERDTNGTTLGEICSGEPFTVAPDDEVDAVVATMHDRGIRRVPVVDGDTAVGILSIVDVPSAQVGAGAGRQE